MFPLKLILLSVLMEMLNPVSPISSIKNAFCRMERYIFTFGTNYPYNLPCSGMVKLNGIEFRAKNALIHASHFNRFKVIFVLVYETL